MNIAHRLLIPSFYYSFATTTLLLHLYYYSCTTKSVLPKLYHYRCTTTAIQPVGVECKLGPPQTVVLIILLILDPLLLCGLLLVLLLYSLFISAPLAPPQPPAPQSFLPPSPSWNSSSSSCSCLLVLYQIVNTLPASDYLVPRSKHLLLCTTAARLHFARGVDSAIHLVPCAWLSYKLPLSTGFEPFIPAHWFATRPLLQRSQFLICCRCNLN